MSAPWYEVAFGAHYPRLYAHRDEAEAQRAVAALLRLAPLGPGPVLDLGCGAGRHARALAAAAAPVIGLDLSAPLLAAAAAGGSPARLVRADMRAVPLRRGCVTAVVSLFTSFGYFGPPAAHAGVVAEVARVLVPGGHWFLDYLDPEAARRELSPGEAVACREVDGVLRARECRRLAGDAVAKRVELTPLPGHEAAAAALGVPAGGLAYTEEVTLFSLAELDALTAPHGLRRVAAAGGYAGQPLGGAGADRWLLAFRRADGPGAGEAGGAGSAGGGT